MSINKVFLVGNLTRDPVLKTTNSGTSVLDFGIAVNDRRKNAQTGEWEDVPNFFDVSVFGNRAEGLSRFLRRGLKVAIDGRLRWRQWETPEGDKRSKVDVTAENIEVLTPREGAGQVAEQQQAPAFAEEPADVEGEEIPF